MRIAVAGRGMAGVYTAAGVRVILVNTIAGWGGGESWTEATALALGARGHDLAVLAREGEPLLARLRARGLATRAAPVGPLAQLWAARRRLGAWVSRFDPEAIVAISGPDLRLLHLLAGPRTGRVFRRGLDRPLGRDPYHRWLGGRVDAMVANSEATRRTLLASWPDFPPERVHTIPNPVDPARLVPPPGRDVRRELGIPAGTFVVAVVGRLVPQKGHRVLIAAFDRLRKEHPDSALVLVGGGPLAGELAQEIERRELGAACHLVGQREAEEVGAYYAAADVVAVPSLFEGFCYAAVEGALLGRPVVAARVSSLPEVVRDGETGFLVPVEDPAALAERLAVLARDPALGRRLGERGQERARAEFAPPAIHARLEAVLAEAVNVRARKGSH
jgi:glycosyltransferase involved in cell wall biosynthesis